MLPALSAEDQAASGQSAQGWDGNKHRLLEEMPEDTMRPYQPSTSTQQASQIQSPMIMNHTAVIPELEV